MNWAMPLASPTMHTDALLTARHRLTRKERQLLTTLMENPGRCISRESLLRSVWRYAEGAKSRTVDVHVQRLRRKLGPDAAAIKTIVRAGYCWLPEASIPPAEDPGRAA